MIFFLFYRHFLPFLFFYFFFFPPRLFPLHPPPLVAAAASAAAAVLRKNSNSNCPPRAPRATSTFVSISEFKFKFSSFFSPRNAVQWAVLRTNSRNASASARRHSRAVGTAKASAQVERMARAFAHKRGARCERGGHSRRTRCSASAEAQREISRASPASSISGRHENHHSASKERC